VYVRAPGAQIPVSVPLKSKNSTHIANTGDFFPKHIGGL
jgi:hypothetical protein